MFELRTLMVAMVLAILTATTPRLEAGAIINLSLPNTLAPNDDGSTGAVALGIDGPGGINFLGQTFTDVYVNNNGNLTFQGPLSQYTPNSMATGVGQPIIAPFFADVDTRGLGSGVVTYGNATIDGREAFVADYINVGYFYQHTDKLDSFQVILIDRSDTGAGNFDIEFNYDSIQWETGDASGGRDGLGGTSAVVGYSGGGSQGLYYQLGGSLVNGAFLDGGPDSLIGNTLGGSGILGRYDLAIRNAPEPASIGLVGVGLVAAGMVRRRARR